MIDLCALKNQREHGEINSPHTIKRISSTYKYVGSKPDVNYLIEFKQLITSTLISIIRKLRT